ncbi:MAG: endolytic transglycosylase MltG [Burkholderiales bacterium]|nr:endolytic transglycosylase MltG [Burkholderiales bacterium]
MIRWIVKLGLAAVFFAALFTAWLIAFAYRPVSPPFTPFEFSIKHGSSLRNAAQQIRASGLIIPPWQFELMARLLGKERGLKAGNYELLAPVTPLDLLTKLRSGDAVQSEVSFIEGHTFAQLRKVLSDHAALKHDSTELSEQAILARIGAKETHPEGLFFPDTYMFTSGMSELSILKRAYQTMQANLSKAWKNRAPGLPYETPYQALIMASIVEKETGRGEERPHIAAVFINRLKLRMKLQTDPTVIYGMGLSFDGNIRKRDLIADTPYNTYTRVGLPPTPIAMPGLAAIESALHPAASNDLYFVAKGDGSHHFSASLEEHNRAVARYQK